MKWLLLASLFSHALMAAPIKHIDLSQALPPATSIDMLDFQFAHIGLKAEEAMPQIVIENGILGECRLLEVLERGHLRTLVVEFEPVLDDGRNACAVKITQPSGETGQVELFIDVET